MMMKKEFLPLLMQKGWLFLVFFLCRSLSAFADWECDFTVNNIHYNFIAGTTDEVEVSCREYESGRYGGYYSNYTGYVTVPASVTYNSKIYKVTRVGSGAFAEKSSLYSVSLPGTITSIGSYAFGDCNQLYSVNIPTSVKSIGMSAFNGCVALNSISIPNGVTEIGDRTFQDCRSLSSITIPNSVTTIGVSAFSGCSNLTTISIPSGVTSVGSDAFYGIPWLNNQADGLIYIGKVAYKYKGTMPTDTDITLKDGTTSIAKAAFSGCSGLRSINIPEGVTSIGASAFTNCTSLKAVTLPKSLTEMGEIFSSSVFYGCSELKDVTILCPNIGNWWFREVSSIENITFGNLVTSIGPNAFYLCNGLTSVTIPQNVTNISSEAFAYCANLVSVSILNTHASIASTAFSGTPWFENQPDGMIYIGQVAYKYKGSMPENERIIIREGTVEIADNAFYYCTDMASVSIPSSVKKIGASAFYGCSGLTSANIPNNVTDIGASAFYGCNGLTSVNIPSSVTTIGSNAFYGCNSLTNVHITSLADWCKITFATNFSNPLSNAHHLYLQNQEIEHLTLPEGLQAIGAYTFYGCSGLTSVNIPSDVMTIGTAAFNGCSGLTSITIPDDVRTIDESAFQGCSGLTTAMLPNSITRIGNSAFSGCSGLTSIVLPRNVESIGNSAFANCSLTTVVAEMTEPIPLQTTAFANYSSYSYVSYLGNVTLYVPKGSKEAYQAASVWQNFKEIKEYYKPIDISEFPDVVYAESIKCIKGGTSTLTISLKNAQATNAYSFDLVLPEGVVLVTNNQGEYVFELSNRHSGHVVSVTQNETTAIYSFDVFSLSSNEVKDNDGAIWKLKLRISDNANIGDYVVKIQNAQYSPTTNDSKVSMPTTTSLLTIEDDLKGDLNGDGAVNISDVTTLVNLILGK